MAKGGSALRGVAHVQVSSELAEIRLGSQPVGFVEQAGPVFVALHGCRYDRAVEIAQSISLAHATEALLGHVQVVERLTKELSETATEPALVDDAERVA